MNKRVILMLILVLTTLLTLHAESCLVLQMRSGQTHSYVLSQQPAITFGEGTLTLTSAEAEAIFELKDIENFHFSDTENGIHAVSNDEMRFTYLNGIVTVEGCKSHVVMTDLTGHSLKGNNIGQTFTFDLSDQPQGTYLLHMGQQSIKLYHR